MRILFFFVFILFSCSNLKETNKFKNEIDSINVITPPYNLLQKNISFKTTSEISVFISYWIKNSNSVKYSAFRLELYKDPDYVQQFLATGNESDFEVQRDGIVGTDGSLSLKMSESLPNTLYYNFILDNELFISDEKKRIIDQDVKSFNTIFASPSPYDGSQTVSGIGTTSFEYELNTLPERVSYGGTINVANSEYTTTSLKAYGAISKIDIVDNGYGYKSIPGISSIKTGIGTGAIVYGESKNIGKISKTEFSSRNIGWNYPTDKTLKLTANLPEIVEINDHPWFIGVQYHPELKSKPFDPHPLFKSFIKASMNQSRINNAK